MHDLAFADAARPTRVACLRLPLCDYSLGHELLLQRELNPILLLPADQFNALPLEEQILSLNRAVLLCSQTWRQNIKPPWFWRLWLWRIKTENYPLALADFRNYLAAGRALLPRPTDEADAIANGERDDKGRGFGAPFLAQLYNYMVAHHARIWPEPWDVPYALAAALYFTHLETEGTWRIENLRESEIKTEMDGHRAAVAAEEADAAKN